MKKGDTQLGTPNVLYTGTKAAIEGLTGISEGATAYATDTDQPGWYTGGAWQWDEFPTTAHLIQDEGNPTTFRPTLNFVGDGVTVSDDGGGNKTVITIPGAAGGTIVDHDHSGAGNGGTFNADNLTAGGANDGDVLTADGAGGAAWEAPTGGSFALDDLTDVNAPAPNNNDVLTWDAGGGEWVPEAPAAAGGTVYLDDLGDVNAPAPNDNDVLSWDDATSKWIPVAPGAGSGHTIQDEGTPLTARANLNFVGSGVTATDDAGNDATIVTIPGAVAGGVDEALGPMNLLGWY